MKHPTEPTICHMSIGTNDFDKAIAFYDDVLSTLGIARVYEHEGAISYGRGWPTFWVQKPFDGQQATVGNGVHIGFYARNKQEVHAFYQEAIANGATCDGKPGPRAEYGEPYYGCFVRDLDGHKIEASYWDKALAEQIYGKSE